MMLGFPTCIGVATHPHLPLVGRSNTATGRVRVGIGNACIPDTVLRLITVLNALRACLIFEPPPLVPPHKGEGKFSVYLQAAFYGNALDKIPSQSVSQSALPANPRPIE